MRLPQKSDFYPIQCWTASSSCRCPFTLCSSTSPTTTSTRCQIGCVICHRSTAYGSTTTGSPLFRTGIVRFTTGDGWRDFRGKKGHKKCVVLKKRQRETDSTLKYLALKNCCGDSFNLQQSFDDNFLEFSVWLLWGICTARTTGSSRCRIRSRTSAWSPVLCTVISWRNCRASSSGSAPGSDSRIFFFFLFFFCIQEVSDYCFSMSWPQLF